MCSACSGDYENPDTTATDETEEIELLDQAMGLCSDCGGDFDPFELTQCGHDLKWRCGSCWRKHLETCPATQRAAD